jgi:hypothetical protein
MRLLDGGNVMRALFLAALMLGACDDSKDDTQGGGDADADTDVDSDTDADADTDADTDCTPAAICEAGGPNGAACTIAPFELQPKQCASWFQNEERCTNGKMAALIDCECGCMEPKKGGKAADPLCTCMQQCMATICGGGGGNGDGGGN